MHPQFVHPQYHNDFASWVYYRLHDHVLAEQLSIIDPTEFADLEGLRQELLEIIEEELDSYEIVLWTKKEDRFHFLYSNIIVFDSSLIIAKPEDLAEGIKKLPPSSIFYHFIDARTRTPEKIDDFSLWLKTFGDQYSKLIENIQGVDPYFLSLTELKDELGHAIQRSFDHV